MTSLFILGSRIAMIRINRQRALFEERKLFMLFGRVPRKLHVKAWLAATNKIITLNLT